MRVVNVNAKIMDKKLRIDGIICTIGWSGGTGENDDSFAVAIPFG